MKLTPEDMAQIADQVCPHHRMSEPRFYAAQVADSLNHGDLRWRVKDRLKPGYIAIFDGIIVPGILTKAKAIEYAERLNTSWGTSSPESS